MIFRPIDMHNGEYLNDFPSPIYIYLFYLSIYFFSQSSNMDIISNLLQLSKRNTQKWDLLSHPVNLIEILHIWGVYK